jgi:hypothetical protein
MKTPKTYLTALQYKLLKAIRRGQFKNTKHYRVSTLESLFRRGLVQARREDGIIIVTEYGLHALKLASVLPTPEMAKANRILRKRRADLAWVARVFR